MSGISTYYTRMAGNNRDIDTLIIGQGLAGSILAWQLMQHGQSVLVVNQEYATSASRVAAGLFNPVTGQRFVLQAKAEAIIPAARRLYSQLEKQFRQTLFFAKPMLRIIRNEKELAAIQERKTDPAYADYLGDTVQNKLLNAPLGAIEQRQTGYLDTNALLDCLKSCFVEQHIYITTQLDYSDITVTESGISWNDLNAKRIIFCEGYVGRNNPWFNWLPFQPAKGEILTLRSNSILPDQIINGGRWLLPVHDGNYKTGATYDHDLSSTKPTEHAKLELVDAMQQLLTDKPDYEVMDHQSGVRPNTLDKNPFIGFHPEQHQVGIFNGFGSKGSMLIPWYADEFVKHITCGTDMPAEADISRVK